jgi:hypothetical protein
MNEECQEYCACGCGNRISSSKHVCVKCAKKVFSQFCFVTVTADMDSPISAGVCKACTIESFATAGVESDVEESNVDESNVDDLLKSRMASFDVAPESENSDIGDVESDVEESNVDESNVGALSQYRIASFDVPPDCENSDIESDEDVSDDEEPDVCYYCCYNCCCKY